MSKKLSKTQRDVLTVMVKAHCIIACHTHAGCRLRDTRKVKVWEWEMVRRPTVTALYDRGLIRRLDRESPPWNRRDFVITDAGRTALDND